jgi:putative tryptophan/tyrosine transport system substrate-binding protein
VGFVCLVLIAFFFALCFRVEAQQQGVPRIGYVRVVGIPSTPGPNVEAFLHGLRDLGYVEGKNIAIEYRYADGNIDRISTLVTELLQLKVDVLVSGDSQTIRAAKKASNAIRLSWS